MPSLHMSPDPGSRLAKHVGDRLCVRLHGEGLTGTAFLRTNLTRAGQARGEVVALAAARASDGRTFAGASWRDIPMTPCEGGWQLKLPLTEVGHFRAKAYARDAEGRQQWPLGQDLGISVLPDGLRSANTIYCAFPRLFGPARKRASLSQPGLEGQIRSLDGQGYAVIPPSGKLRDLRDAVPHIVDDLGCRILHLLPLGPTPTTYARMGRFGSPYAQLDLTDIDPALVVFDRRTTAEDQFRELADAMHVRGGLVFLDIVINHTGWGSRLQANHPDWFEREPDGSFHSPGAWGNTWADLVELQHEDLELWATVAESLLVWCRRGVDGFRCDAGYMVPLPVWEFLQARVRQEFPDTVFLLEGLGGAWELTEALLTEGGMQWAYSELFQNYSPSEVAGYVDHALRQAERMGPLVHYSETHDNARLAAKGRTWSLMRNRLCALASVSGAFGFTCGVEWLATEKVDVHEATGLNWGAPENLVTELAHLNRLLADHPCFFDGARIERISPDNAAVLALARHSAEGKDSCLVLLNLDPDGEQELELAPGVWEALGCPSYELLGQAGPLRTPGEGGQRFRLRPGAGHCLSPNPQPLGLSGLAYRQHRARAAWALNQAAQVLPIEGLGSWDWRTLSTLVDEDPRAFLAALPRLAPLDPGEDLPSALRAAQAQRCYPALLEWEAQDARRVTPVPPGHWLMISDPAPFTLHCEGEGALRLHLRAVPAAGKHVAALSPGQLGPAGEGQVLKIRLERHQEGLKAVCGELRLLPESPVSRRRALKGTALLTNGRGAMSRLQVELGTVASKYDCMLGANLHPQVPCDRHVLVKRLRAWVIAEGFLTTLDGDNLAGFEAGPSACWRFRANAGDGRWAEIRLQAWMPPGENTVQWRMAWVSPEGRPGELGPEGRVVLTLRLDLEDRSYHAETQANSGADAHFQGATRPLDDQAGFSFAPAPDRTLRAWTGAGTFHPEPEWCLGIPHPTEGQRGQVGSGDAWSPGWFEVPLAPGRPVLLTVTAETGETDSTLPLPNAAMAFEERLKAACSAFLAKRGEGLTVIAGYPWFLDWGRDTLIACRGLLAAGWEAEVMGILRTFGALERQGTLPNALGGEDTSNRETSDAPLWFALACEEAAERLGIDCLNAPLPDGRTLAGVLSDLATGHLSGTAVGVRVDPDSGLVWSPAHFTWMDTNHPAGTPREGYPIELQALWIRLLRFLARLGLPCPHAEGWSALAERSLASLDRYWNDQADSFADCLHAPMGIPAREARADDHLRPNQLFLISLGLVQGDRARRAVSRALRHLLVPGALRSLAPLTVTHPLPLRGAWGQPLNDPWNPYWGQYAGDEDTRRKPAYHNGTAWVWLLPTACEALARAWDFEPAAGDAAKALLADLSRLLDEGCLEQLPELVEGDAPHAQRGCDAQAWSVSEALRVWHLLSS